MASKYYQIVFGGDGNPATQTGLTPTFIQFRNLATGATVAPPGITEIYTGIYRFEYDAPVGTQISFICDGGSSLTTGRYITGDLTALQGMDVVLGSTASSIGSTATDPGDVMGQLMRNQERWEGLASFSKTTGLWTIQTRGGTTIFARTLANSTAQVVKT